MKLVEELTYYRKRLRSLTLNDKGKKSFIDEADDVFEELFGLPNFVSKFLDAKTPQKCDKLLDKIDRKSFTKIIGTKEYYKIVAQLVVIRVEMTRKNKKVALTDKELKKLYRKVISKLINKVEIELPTNGIDVKFLKSFYKDGYDYDDDEFYFGGDDDDDVDEFDDMKEFFSSSKSPKKKSKKRSPWDIDNDDFDDDDEDDDDEEDSTASLLQSFIKEQGKVNKSLIRSINELASAPAQQPQVAAIPIPTAPSKSSDNGVAAALKALTNKISAMDNYNHQANKSLAQSIIELGERVDDIEEYLSSEDGDEEEDDTIGEEELAAELTGGQSVPSTGTGLVRLAQSNVKRGTVSIDDIDANISDAVNR